jgi:hypothetical protein|tara:strand:+ start:5163 stop:5336 length:174 start_codon:yes stop_codon:yes gene_type:complete
MKITTITLLIGLMLLALYDYFSVSSISGPPPNEYQGSGEELGISPHPYIPIPYYQRF